MLSQHLATVSSCSGLGACWIAYGFLRLVIAVCCTREWLPLPTLPSGLPSSRPF
jgi:hypothetical protein